MKRSVFLSLVFLLCMSMTYGQKADNGKGKETKQEPKKERVPLKKLEGTSVNVIAKNNFAAGFTDATNVKWTRSANFDEATFTRNNEKVTAYYDSDGNLVGTATPKKFADLPEKGRQAIKEKYKDYTVGPVIFFDDNKASETDMILWSTQFDDEDAYFVELTKGTKKIVVQVNTFGVVTLFKNL
jgi:hypothetical protein